MARTARQVVEARLAKIYAEIEAAKATLKHKEIQVIVLRGVLSDIEEEEEGASETRTALRPPALFSSGEEILLAVVRDSGEAGIPAKAIRAKVSGNPAVAIPPSEKSFGNYLRRMANRGVIERVGPPRYARWRVPVDKK